jgi:hypothetical protein
MLAAVAHQVQLPASAFACYLLYGSGASSALDEHHPGDGRGPGQQEGSFSLQKVFVLCKLILGHPITAITNEKFST